MSKVYAFLADGFELIEALAVVDVLRRASVEVVTVSIGSSKEVASAQSVTVIADTLFEQNDYSDADVLFLPGGMPGTRNLEAHEGLKKILCKQYDAGKTVAAICAAPSVFGHYGFLEGRMATCFPGFESELKGATYSKEKVVEDGNVITSRGMGTAIDLGLALTKRLLFAERADDLAKKIQYIV